MIIFNEKKYAEEIIKSGFKRFMSTRDLIILSKYFFYMGKSQSEVSNDIIDFCSKKIRSFNLVVYEDKINYSIRKAGNSEIRIPDNIEIFKEEIDKFSSESYNNQKLLFTMLVIAKVFGKKSSYYVNASLTDIFSLSKVYYSKDEKIQVMNELYEKGYISPTYTGGIKINYALNSGTDGIRVSDFDNIVSFLPVYCDICGKEIDKKPRRHMRCEVCNEEYQKVF